MMIRLLASELFVPVYHRFVAGGMYEASMDCLALDVFVSGRLANLLENVGFSC